MDVQTADTVDRQRPFKIFISLLDKWEIGGPLTEVLVLDAFAALQASLRPNDDHDEASFCANQFGRDEMLTPGFSQLLMTGNMLFEIIDPFLMWKQIYASVRENIGSSGKIEVRQSLEFLPAHSQIPFTGHRSCKLHRSNIPPS